MEFSRKSDLVSAIKTLISTNDYVAIEALQTLYRSQTFHEISRGRSSMCNNIGFNKPDSTALSLIARVYTRTGCLSGTEFDTVRNRMPKYAKQFVNRMISTGAITKLNNKYIYTLNSTINS